MWPRSIRGWPPIVLFSLLVALATGSCAWWQWTLGGAAGVTAFGASRFNPLYRGQYRAAAVEPLVPGAPRVRLAFVESDDHGWFHDPAQARVVLDTVEALASRGNVAVVVYVHGWRHSASTGDRDVESFRRTLEYLGDRLHDPTMRRARAEHTQEEGTTVVGVFVGWRGRMAPELPVPLGWINAPVYATFWSRKATAHVVGRGDLREFLLHLDDLYQERNVGRGRRIALVIIGHSFGGHIVFDATRDRIEGHLFNAMLESGSDDGPVSGRLYPTPPGSGRIAARHLVRGFGDLVVLINPAIEADGYRRIDEAVRRTRFLDAQAPILLVVSAENDWARNSLFASARGFSLVGTRRSPRQRGLLGRALGSYAPQITHVLELRTVNGENKRRARRSLLDDGKQGPRAGRDDPPILIAAKEPAVYAPPAAPLRDDEAELLILRPIDPAVPETPARVVRASDLVISGHSDFFRRSFVSWLTREVLAAQRRQLALSEAQIQQAK